jgi:hypothetical protein
MPLILPLLVVLGFSVLAPGTYDRHGPIGLCLLAAAASVLAAGAFILTGASPGPPDAVDRFFFWPALVAAGSGFALLVILTQRRGPAPSPRPTLRYVLIALVLWVAGAAFGGILAAAAIFVALSQAAE